MKIIGAGPFSVHRRQRGKTYIFVTLGAALCRQAGKWLCSLMPEAGKKGRAKKKGGGPLRLFYHTRFSPRRKP